MVSTTTGIPQDRIVGFGDSIGLGLRNYFNFNGRSSRGAYWYWTLAMVLFGVLAAILDAVLFSRNVYTPISSLLSLVTFIPGLSIGVRRLHDIGKSGWWLLIILTVIGALLILFWDCQPGNRAENRYGSDQEAGRA